MKVSNMDSEGFTLVVWCIFFPLAQCQSFSCTRIHVRGATHHTAYNGIYTKTGDQCRDSDTYRQENGDGLLVQRSPTDGWAVVTNPQMETCPTTTASNIRLLGGDEVEIPSMVLSLWSEFVNQRVMSNNHIIVECDDIFMKVSCTNSSLSSIQLCPLGSEINIREAYYFTDGTSGKPTCNVDNVVCSSTFAKDELKSLRSYCDGHRACLPWVVPSVRHRNCERNSDIQCDETADTIEGFLMRYRCKRNRGCKDIRLVNTTYHSDLPSIYSQVEGVMCNERNVYSNGDYYLWYSTLSGMTEAWYFGQQSSSSGFQCDGAVGTVATADHVQYPEDATVWYEDPPDEQDFHQTAAMVVCKDRPLFKYPDPCSPPTTADTFTTVADVQLTTHFPVITVEDITAADNNTITTNDATHTSIHMDTTTIYNDKSKLAKPEVAVIAEAAAGGGGVVIIVVIIVTVLLIRRRNKKSRSSPADYVNNPVTTEMNPQVTSSYENTGREYEIVNADTDYSTIRENVKDHQNVDVPNADYQSTTTNIDNAYQMLKESRDDYVNVTENTGPNVYTSLQTNTQ